MIDIPAALTRLAKAATSLMPQCPLAGSLDGLTNVRRRTAVMPYPLRMVSRSWVCPPAFFQE